MNIYLLKSYFLHRFRAVDEHAIHSPYFFDFYMKVIKKRNKKIKGNPEIEKLRKALQNEHTPIHQPSVEPTDAYPSQTLASIAKNRSNTLKLSLLYRRILHYIDAKNTVEIGSSVGLNTLYLAHQRAHQVVTFEDNMALAKVATQQFSALNEKNIKICAGNISHTLSDFIAHSSSINFALIKIEDQGESTVQHFNTLVEKMDPKGVMVINNIHQSINMESAWQVMKHDKRIYGSIDVYQCGLLFLNPILNRLHYICSF